MALLRAQAGEAEVGRAALEGRFTPTVEALASVSEEMEGLASELEAAQAAAAEERHRAELLEAQLSETASRLRELEEALEAEAKADSDIGHEGGEEESASLSVTPRGAASALIASADSEGEYRPAQGPPPQPLPRGELDKRFQNIAWLVATRGTFVVALGEFNKALYESPNLIAVKRTRMRFMELLRDYLSPVEKLHLGLPQEISAIEPVTREANQRELIRMLVHSSMANSYPGQDPPVPAPRPESPPLSPRRARTRHYAEPIPPLNFSRQVSRAHTPSASTPQPLSRNASFTLSSPTGKTTRVAPTALRK